MEEIIKQYVTIWNTKGVSEIENIFTRKSKYWDALQQGKAIELLTSSILATHEAFSDISFQITSFRVASENECFLEWLMTGTNTGEFFGAAPTGRRIEIRGIDSIELEHDQISEIKSFYDSSLFNQQLGLA